MIGVEDAALVQQLQSIARRLALIGQQRRQERFLHRRPVRLTQREGLRVGVPLHRMAEQVGQQEQTLLGRDGEIDMNLRAVEVADQGSGDVARHHAHLVPLFDPFRDGGAKFQERQVAYGHGTII